MVPCRAYKYGLDIGHIYLVKNVRSTRYHWYVKIGCFNFPNSVYSYCFNIKLMQWCLLLLVSIFRALVYICHGVGEHCRAYDKVAKALNEIGVFVFSHDHGIVSLLV